MKLLIFFGKSLNISLIELALIAIVCHFENDDAVSSQSYHWHEMHSLSFAEDLGFVAYQATSKHLGIGSAEQSWSDVKTIKNGKMANIGGESLEKRAILYAFAKLEEAQLLRNWIH